MTRRPLIALTLALTLVGLSIFLYKALILNFPLVPEVQSDIWEVEAHISFAPDKKPVKVSMQLPRDSSRFAIINENFISRGYGVNVASEDGKRKIHWSIRKAGGIQNLYYRASVRRVNRNISLKMPKGAYPEKPDFNGAYREAAEALVSEAREMSADTDSIVIELLQRLNNPRPGDNATLLLGKKPSPQKKVDLCVQLLALAGIHARSVHGIRLEVQNRNASIFHWLEIYDQKRWISYDPVSARRGVSDDYLAWWQGMEPLVQSQGTKRLATDISVFLSGELAIQAALETVGVKKPLLLDFSLFSLPIETQAVYRVILLLPVGVFLLVILRNVIGIRTFGTFMPVLIALAFRETQLLWGLFMFTVLIALGLSIRLYLTHLKLLVVPRLAAILIIVIYLMAVFSILTHRLGLERGLSVALFPMVIVTMTIERMSIVWEELDAYQALKQGAWSLVAAVLAYLVMSVRIIEHFVFVFPEMLLVLLAGTLWLGRYSGFRLLELVRFKSLAKSKSDV
jgi:7 transmembrane helices usually fused to an inactive transglutaminase/Inactive transglutaminase fused to 7 transmembrane helices/Transglutaminase-like superfamily